MDQVKILAKQSFIYGLPGFISPFIAIFLIPIYTNILLPEEIGAITLIVTVVSIFYIFLSVGMGTAVFRTYFFEKEEERAKVINTSFLFLILYPGLILLPLIIFSPVISQLLFNSSEYTSAIRISLAGLFFNASLLIPYAYFRAKEKPFTYVCVTMAQLIGNAFFSILFVLVFHMGVEGAVLGTTTGNIIAFVLGLIFLLPSLSFHFSLRLLKEVLSYGVPLIPAGFAMWGLNSSDRFFLQFFHGLSDVGFYNVGYRIGQIVSLPVGAFQVAWFPFIFKIAKKKTSKTTYALVTSYYFTVLISLVFLIAVFSKPALMLLTPSFYWKASILVGPIGLSYLFYGLFLLFSVGLHIKKKSLNLVFVVLFGLILNIFMNWILIPPYGYFGAAVSTLLSFLSIAVVSYFLSRRSYKINYNWFRILVNGLLVLVVYVPILLIQEKIGNNFWFVVLVAFIGTVTYFVGLVLFKLLDAKKMISLVYSLRPT